MVVPQNRHLLRDINRTNRALRRFELQVGQWVEWYEFDPTSVADNTDTDIYDEGGTQGVGGTSRHWFAPKVLPVIQAVLDEGAQQFLDTGNYQVARLTLIVSHDTVVRNGISQPVDRGAHLNDRIGYDNRLFSIDSYTPRGRIANALMTVTIACTEVKDDEQQTDDTAWFG